mmetsp:Transcript_24984/g.56575  ORF Transcript_24984/g.56575 Transcript_24984/m.56575 type:complete len:82 (-) Transcript_24984:32-277(-)
MRTNIAILKILNRSPRITKHNCRWDGRVLPMQLASLTYKVCRRTNSADARASLCQGPTKTPHSPEHVSKLADGLVLTWDRS